MTTTNMESSSESLVGATHARLPGNPTSTEGGKADSYVLKSKLDLGSSSKIEFCAGDPNLCLPYKPTCVFLLGSFINSYKCYR